MQTFDQAIMRLHKQGMISFEEAMSNASNPDDLDLRLKGIVGAADRWDEEHKKSDSPEPSARKRAPSEMPGGLGKF
jgi:twitching motility protein PilT